MLIVNGVPLHNPAMGWVFTGESVPFVGVDAPVNTVKRAGRDGGVHTSATLNAPVFPVEVVTPVSGWAALQSLFNAPELVLTRADFPDVEAVAQRATSDVGKVYLSSVMIRATFYVRLPRVFWRSKSVSTFARTLTSPSVDVEVFPAAPGGVVSQVKNLFTNPGFEAGSGTVEVRRNYGNAISAASPSSRFADYANTTRSVVSDPLGSGASVFEVVTTGLAGGFTQNVSTHNLGAAENMPAGVATFTARMLGAPGQMLRVVVQEYSPSITLRGEQYGAFFAATGEWQEVTIPYTVRESDSRTRVAAQAQTAGTFHVWGFSSETGSTAGGLILPGFSSPDPDLTASWTGTANASESILTGVPVSGVTAMACLAIKSSKFGGSMRLIANSTVRQSFAEFTIPAGARPFGTLLGTAHIEAPVTDPGAGPHPDRLRLVALSPTQVSEEPPNVPGSYPQRLQYEVTSYNRARFMHGGSQGSPDVYWTMAGLFQGVYDGPWFSGSTVSSSRLETYEWDGIVNGSPSTHTIYESWDGGLSAPIQDGVIRVRGMASGIQLTDASGAWLTLPDIPAGEYVRFDMDTGRAWHTTTDTWAGGTEVSGMVDFGGPRGVFEITPVLAPGDPDSRKGVITVATASRSAAVVEVRAKDARLI